MPKKTIQPSLDTYPIAPWLKWWYQLTTPAYAEREIERKTRILSLVVFLLLVDNISFATSGVLNGSTFIFFVLAGETILTIVAILFNRKKAVFTAGLIITLTYTIGIMTSLMLVQHINAGTFTIFALFVIPEVLAAALLPAIYVLIFAITNSLFMVMLIEIKPYAAGLSSKAAFSYFFIVITILLLVAGISFVLINGLQTALKQRDHAEGIAELERQLTIAAEAKAQEKKQLDYSIQMINNAQARFANGELNVRVPLTSNNVLWSVAGSLNNLFVRLQRQQEMQQDGERLMQAVTTLQDILQKQRQGRITQLYQPSGTIVDQLAITVLPSSMFEQEQLQSDFRKPGHFRKPGQY